MTELLAHYSGSATGTHQPWLVLKQEGVQDDAATIGDSGDLIDKLFDLSPCTEQIEGGEEAETDEEGEPAAPLDLTDAKTIIQEEYGFAGCGDGDGDRYLLRVYRSDISLPYKLLLDNGEELSVVQKNDTYQAVIAVDMDDRAELSYPLADPDGLRYHWRTIRDRSGSMSTVPVSVAGQYLQFPREVAGLLEIAYPVAYDLVEIRIPRKGSEPGKCRVTALYGGAAYEIDIEPVKLDPAMDGFARRFGCGDGDDHYEFPDSDEPVCYERIYHRVLCRCTREDAKSYQQNIGGDSLSYTTEGEVPCPDWLTAAGYSGRFAMGSRSVIEKYVDCGGAVEGTGTAQEYENICCEPGTPPACDKIYRKFKGGKAFDKEAAIAEYGENVVLIPVGPADGQCGEWVTEYQKPGGSCCDGAPSPVWEKTHTSLSWNESYIFRVVDGSGTPPYTWSTTGKGLSVSGSGASALVTVSDCFCEPGQVIVTDACDKQISHAVTSEEGQWVEITEGEWGGPDFPLVEHYTDGAFLVWENDKWKVAQAWETGWAGSGCFSPIDGCEAFDSSVVKVHPDMSTPASEFFASYGFEWLNDALKRWSPRFNTCNGVMANTTDNVSCDPGEATGYRSIDPREVYYYKWDCGKWTELLYDNENSADVIAQNSNAMIKWQGGKAPFWVELSGQGFFLDASFQLQAFQFSGNTAKIYTGESCGYCDITITDSCGNIVAGEIHSEGEWKKLGYEILKAYDLVPDIVAEYNLYNCVSRYIHAKITWPSTYGRYGFNNVDAYTEPSGSVEVATHYQGAGLEDGNCRTTSLATQSVWATFYGATVKIPLNTEFFWSDYYERWAGYFLQDAFYFFEFTCPE